MYNTARVVKRITSGKTLCIDIVVGNDGRIVELIVSGDFFVYPEEAIEAIEEKARGCLIDELIGFIKELEFTPIGFSKEDLVRAVVEAYRRAINK